MKTLVTIGITTFNAVETVEDAIKSALSQTWRPIEIVVIDDCSTDGTLNLVKSLALKHTELRVLNNEKNQGVAFSRNRILAEAKGEFVAFFDDDDVSAPSRIYDQYVRITDYEKKFAVSLPVVCHTARVLLYPNGDKQMAITMGQVPDKPAPSGIPVAKRILMGMPLQDGYGSCPTCSQMARLSTYRLIAGFDESFRRSEDTDFIIRLAQVGGHFVGIDIPLVTQKMTKTSEKSLFEEYRNTILLLKKHRAIMDQEGEYEFCCKWINLKQEWLLQRYGRFVLQLLVLIVRHPRLTMRRLYWAFPNIGLNFAFSRFHASKSKS